MSSLASTSSETAEASIVIVPASPITVSSPAVSDVSTVTISVGSDGPGTAKC